MLVNGVIVISVITATISSRFVSDPDKGELPVSLDDIDERLARIEAALGILNAAQAPGGAGTPSDGDDGTPPPATLA
jgi:hypothetical protein